MSCNQRSIRYVVATVVACGALAACSSSSPPASTSRKQTPPKSGAVRATPALVVVKSAGAEVPFPDADKTAVLSGVETYVHDATLAPLKGTTADLTKLFAANAAPPATGPDSDALSDAPRT